MKSVTLSIITLTKNRAPLLEKNFKSLRGQLKKSDEIIVIDNGSTDETKQVIRRFQPVLPIRAYFNVRGTYSRLYNTGVNHAKKDIVVFFDDDCTAEAHFIERTRAMHIRKKRCVVQGMTESVPKENIYAGIMGDHYQAFLHANTLPDGTLRILDNKNASISRTLLQKLGGFDESLECGSEDIELGIRLRSHGIPIVFEPSIRAYHHERTTYQTFVAQHLRFAKCEGHLDKILPENERMTVARFPKVRYQLGSALKREMGYIKTGALWHALQLPFLYTVLATIRIWGYATSK